MVRVLDVQLKQKVLTTRGIKMFKYLIAKCPLSGGEYTASDWWEVVKRHKSYTCAEDYLFKITCAQKAKDKYQIFNLKDYQVGEQFNIKAIQQRHKV